jgi:hypothetical protein
MNNPAPKRLLVRKETLCHLNAREQRLVQGGSEFEMELVDADLGITPLTTTIYISARVCTRTYCWPLC